MKITLEVDENALTYTDSYLAALWHAAQHNAAPAEDRDACRLVELIGREIIRRWLASVQPELWMRQGSHAESLPAIERNAHVQNALEAARKVVLCDHAANLAAYRTECIEAVDRLADAMAHVDARQA